MRLFSLLNTLKFTLIISISVMLFSCKKNDPVPEKTRTYRMGFQNSAPRYTLAEALKSLDMWTEVSDAAMITTEVPWDTLYAGVDAAAYVNRNYKSLVDLYKSKNLKLWIYIDPANGLDRATDALQLISRKKSIAQTDVQKKYKRFVFCMDSILKPDHLGLALETNLIRGISPDSIYQGVKKAANEAYAEIRQFDKKVKMSVSLQVDFAWGKLQGGGYLGAEKDFVDFPFMEEVGLSSYPYFGFSNPEEIPIDYYTKVMNGRTLPCFVSEGGWSSESVATHTLTPESQKKYFEHHRKLLDDAKATAWIQLPFTDIDISALPQPVPPNLKYFAFIGIVDKDFIAKPAVFAWNEAFMLKLEE